MRGGHHSYDLINRSKVTVGHPGRSMLLHHPARAGQTDIMHDRHTQNTHIALRASQTSSRREARILAIYDF